MCLNYRKFLRLFRLSGAGGYRTGLQDFSCRGLSRRSSGGQGPLGPPATGGAVRRGDRAATVRDINVCSDTGVRAAFPRLQCPQHETPFVAGSVSESAGSQGEGVRQPTARAPRTSAAAVGRVHAGSGLGQVVAAAPRARRPAGGRVKAARGRCPPQTAVRSQQRAQKGLRCVAARDRDPPALENRPR